MNRSIKMVIAILGLAFAAGPGTVFGAAGGNGKVSTNDGGGAKANTIHEKLTSLRLGEPVTQGDVNKPDRGLKDATGKVQVIIRLSEPSIAASSPGQAGRVEAQQSAFASALAAAGGRQLGSVSRVLNAIFAEVDAAMLSTLAASPSVIAIRKVGTYHKTLSDTVPYIGATLVHGNGQDGSGVSVAVLDSGIDYNHAALGGSGLVEDYENNDPNIVEDGTFPTAKVVGGIDFVGSVWPGGDLAPDDDPLDDGDGGGHGTHVADIIGGLAGVAPGADLYAVKVCSSVSTSCSGIALIQGIEYAVDPNGDGDFSDHLDIINMSLGSDYGQAFDDDLSAAIDNASALGVLTVASAGNASDKPYIVGTPSAAPTALSVAQTQVPSANLQLIDVSGESLPAVFQSWSVVPDSPITAAAQYGAIDGSNLNGCDSFEPGSLTGTVTLVDRGACNFTLKVKNIGDAGGLAGIIGRVAPGAPFSGGDGGDSPIEIPGYMISQSDASIFKAAVGSDATIDPANVLPLVMQMVSSSSRGPGLQFNALIKPEIGAPGASVSAIVGTGSDTGPFGGTSGAAPMVSGSAALVLAGNGGLLPEEVKALLVNTGEININTDPFTGLAPIARIGGGEVRVDRAAGSSVAAYEEQERAPALSFGFVDASSDMSFSKTVEVKNYGDSEISYSIASSFRYANDDTGAVTVAISPSSISVAAGDTANFDVTIEVKASMLKEWSGNSGSGGADPGWITDLEYDGYVSLDASGEANDIHLPWHVLPRKSGNVSTQNYGNGKFTVSNGGEGATLVEAYSLIATSDDLEEGGRGENMPITDFQSIGYRTNHVPAGFCGPTASYVMSFAITSWEQQVHANVPNAYDLYLDYDGDGIPDANIFNSELAGDLSDGRNITYAVDLVSGAFSGWFWTDHETNSSNTVLNVCAEQIGLKAGAVNTIRVAFGGAFDIYFTGTYTDSFGAGLDRGVDDSPVTFQGNHSGIQLLSPGATVKGTRSGARPALLLFRGGAPEGNESAIVE